MSVTISEEYRALNRKLHEDLSYYGAGHQTAQWYPKIAQFAQFIKASSVLDYGCGKGKMRKELQSLMIVPYDPSVPEFNHEPEPHDLVVCLDVLEHIEPELLDAVLDDLLRCTKIAVFFTIHLGPAQKVLADGRNAHLIQKPVGWWLEKLTSRWDVMAVHKTASFEFMFTGQLFGLQEASEGRIRDERAAAKGVAA